MIVIITISVLLSLLSKYESRRRSSVTDVNLNISQDLLREDNLITSIYFENVTRSTKVKGEILMKHIEIYVEYLFRVFESYRRNMSNAVDVAETLIEQRGPMLMNGQTLNETALAKKFHWNNIQVREYKLHYMQLQYYFGGLCYYRWRLGYMTNNMW